MRRSDPSSSSSAVDGPTRNHHTTTTTNNNDTTRIRARRCRCYNSPRTHWTTTTALVVLVLLFCGSCGVLVVISVVTAFTTTTTAAGGSFGGGQQHQQPQSFRSSSATAAAGGLWQTVSPTSASTAAAASLSSSPAKRPTNSRTNQKQQKPKHHYQHQQSKKSNNGLRSSSSSSVYDVEREMARLGRQGRVDEALKLLTNNNKSETTTTVRMYNAALLACARAQPQPRVDTAFALLQQMQQQPQPNLQPNVYTYGALMNVVARAGHVDTAIRLLDEWEQQQQQQQSHNDSGNTTTAATVVPLNAVVYQSAVAAAATAARPDLATAILQRAPMPLSVVGYNAAVAAAARAGQVDTAVEWLERMQQSSSSSNTTTTNKVLPAPDAVTYGTVLAACEYAQKWHLLLQKMDEFQRMTSSSSSSLSGPKITMDPRALMSALHACQQLGLADRAVHYLELMKEVQEQTTIKDSDNGFASHSHSQQQQQQQQQQQPSPDPVAYRMAISACARGKAWQQGLRLLDEYHEAFPATARHDVVAYTAAMTGCEYAGEWQAAVALLKRMRFQSQAPPNEVTLAAFMGACATACANARVNANHNNNNPESAASATTPAPLQKALQLLHVLRKDETVVRPNVMVYNAAIRACAEGLDLSRALELYNLMRHDGLQPTVVTYGTLMTACERVGSMSGMSRVWRLLRDDPNRVRPNEIVYGAALSCCRKAGEAERAYLLLQKMIRQDQLQPNAATFNTVLMAQAEAMTTSTISNSNSNKKETNSNKSIIDRSVTIFGMMHGNDGRATPNRQTYSILIRMLAQNQQPREAEALLRRMRQDHNLRPDVDLYTVTVTAYERVGQPRQALRLMEAMRADGYDFYHHKVLDAAFKRVVKLLGAMVGPAASAAGGNPLMAVPLVPLHNATGSVAPL